MPKSNEIYMDYASGTMPNPSSLHSLGVEAKRKLKDSRAKIASILGARKEEIIFTSGGTESNNLAIQGVVLAAQLKLPHIITTNIEHASVLETFKMLEQRGLAEVSFVSVESNGIVNPKKIKKQIKKNTVLVSVMYANNEIGTIQLIQEIAKEIRHYNKENTKRQVFERSGRGRDPENRGPEKTLPFRVLFHTDAVQAVNYLDLNVVKLGVDMLTLSGSKIERAGKVGVLYKKSSVQIANLFGGGDQESGLRPGTENVEAVVKFSQALEFVQKIKDSENKRLTKLRNYFIDQLIRTNRRIVLNGDLEKRLPNNVNITVPKIPSDLLVIELSARGIMTAAKSACKSGDGKASHVLEAISKNLREEDGSLRFSLGREITKKDIDYTVESLDKILTKLKKWYT